MRLWTYLPRHFFRIRTENRVVHLVIASSIDPGHEVFDGPLCTFAETDHFPDATKMIVRIAARCFTRLYGAHNRSEKVFSLRVTQLILFVI